MEVKAGTRLRSAVSDAEVIVIRAPAADVELTCGGVPMVEGEDGLPAAVPAIGRRRLGRPRQALCRRGRHHRGPVHQARRGRPRPRGTPARAQERQAPAVLRLRAVTLTCHARRTRPRDDPFRPGRSRRRSSADGVQLSHRRLAERSWAAAARFEAEGTPAVVYLGGNHVAFPLALFGAAAAGIPFIPLNYRLASEQIRERLDAHPGAAGHPRGRGPGRRRPRPGGRPSGLLRLARGCLGRPHRPVRPRGALRAPLHERHDLGAQGRRPAAPPSHVLSPRHGRVRRRRGGRSRARHRAPVPHRRRGQPVEQRLRRAAHRLPRPVRPRDLAAAPSGASR